MRALVTGAARGLGRAFVLALAQTGAQVVAADVDAGGLEETARAAAAAGSTVLAVSCDVTSETDAEHAVATAVGAFGGLDALVNNAGIVAVTRAPSREIPATEWDAVMAVNAKGPWLMSRAAIPALTAAGGGAIVNLASETAYSGSRGMSHYVASKAAVVGLTRALARELGPLGIRVNAIAPGYTDTEGGRAIGDPAAYDVSVTPLGRMAVPDDMVGTLLYLLGPGAAFVTGQVVLVNGGRIAG
jgi:NAD(P)-dependent dehydrogenase (short-subunit alcohol dehydrogenase family)